MNKKYLIFSLLSLLFISFSFGQNAYNDGWKAYQKNERAEARKYFNQAAASNSEALLALAFIDLDEHKLNAAFENFKKFYETSPNPYPYLYALSSTPYVMNNGNVLDNNRLAFFEKIVADPKMKGTLKAMLYGRIGEHYERINNVKKARENYAKIGALERWQVLGTFDNTSGSGFGKDWGAVEKAKTSDVFKNKVNADVNWYYPGLNKENKWFHFDYYFPMSDAVMYAQTFVNSPVEQEAYLRAGNSGSLKIWVNDALVSAVSEERNCDLDIYAYKVKLNQGANRLLVQIGASDLNRANFLVRLTDADGNPLPNLNGSENYADYTKSNIQYEVKELPFFAEEFFTEKVNSDKNNPLNYLLLAETYLRNDKTYEGTKVLKNLEKIAEKSTLTSYKLYEAYIRSKNHTDTDKEAENIKNTDPNSFFALQAKYNEAVESEKYTEAEEARAKAIQLYGENEITDDWAISLASNQKRFEDLIKLSKEMYKKYPNNYNYMNLNALIETNVSKNPKGAIAVMEDYLKKNNSSEALGALSQAYFEQGNTAKGLAALYKRSEEKPYAIGFYDNMASVLFKMQMYKEALAATEKQKALSPYLSGVYNNQGFIYKNLNQTDNAKESFKKAIYYQPTNYDARAQLRLLEKSKEIFSLFPESKLTELIAQAPTAKEFPNDNSIVVLNEQQQVVYPEGAKEYRADLAIKILNKSGIEDWKEYAVGYNSYWQKLIIDKAEVIKANGSTSKAETNDNHIVFTNLEVNDVIHIEYRMQDLSTGKLANQFFDHFQFQYTVPVMVGRYFLLAPSDRNFSHTVKNADVKPEISTIENMTLYKWEMKNLPAVVSEPNMSASADILPMLTYSSMPDWKYVSDWYKDLTVSKFNPDYVLKATFNELMDGKEKLSKLEKARIFYNYILENITYSSVDFMQSNYVPQKASRTITTRLGDCKDLSTLFVALCRMADIDANLVLISTRENGSRNLVMPVIDFNHAIAQLNVDNKTYYLELTNNGLPFAAALEGDLNAQILPIPYDGNVADNKLTAFVMPQRLENKSVREHAITFKGNDMSIDRSVVSYGAIAAIKRNIYKSLSAEEQLKQLNENIANDFSIPAKVSALKFTELETLTESVTENYRIDVKGALQEVAGMKIFRLPWSDVNSLDMVAAETRKYPMEYWSYQNEDKSYEKITLNLPANVKLVEAPANKKLECPTASYSLTFDTKNPSKIIVIRTFERKKDVVPVEEYDKFREFINNVSESDNKQYAIK